METPDKTETIQTGKTRKMKVKSKGRLRRILTLPFQFSGIKTLLFIFGLCLSFLSGGRSIDLLNNSLFQFSSGTKKFNPVNEKAGLIALTSQEFDRCLRHPEGLPELRGMIEKTKDRENQKVIFITGDLPDYYRTPENKKSGSVKKESVDLFKSKNVYIAIRQTPNQVFQNHKPGNLNYDKAVEIQSHPEKTFFDYLPEETVLTSPPDVNRLFVYDNKEKAVYPFSVEITNFGWPLVWQNGNIHIIDILAALVSGGADKKYVLDQVSGLTNGAKQIKTDPNGYILPDYSDTLSEQIERLDLKKLPELYETGSLDHPVIFIGEVGDPALSLLPESYLALVSDNVSRTPWQAVWIEKLMILLFFLTLVFLVPRLKIKTACIMISIIVLSVLSVQTGYHRIHDEWLLMTLPLIYLCIGFALVLVSEHQKNRIKDLQQKADRAFFNLGRFQFEQNRYDQAFDSLIECRPDQHVLELLYKLAVALERKRQFDKACTVFEYTSIKGIGYKDSAERAERLQNIIFGRTSVNMKTGTGPLEIGTGGTNKPVLGRYEIEKELGRGAMGIVYYGEDPKIGRKIAVKTLDFTQTFEGRFEEVKERFFREAKAAGRLTHPNIVTIYDAGEEQDLAYIAMDFIPGVTLNAFTKEKVLLPVKLVYNIIRQVADALDYAHKKEIVHRDIKPGNIIYNRETQKVTVTDFGIARIADTTMTRPGVILGSPSFMSPEQLRGKEIDGRADIFSLGVTMYQLLTGKLPFTGTDLSSLGYQITSVKHPPVRSLRPDLPKSADKIISKALQKSPSKRYQTAGGLAKTLRAELVLL